MRSVLCDLAVTRRRNTALGELFVTLMYCDLLQVRLDTLQCGVHKSVMIRRLPLSVRTLETLVCKILARCSMPHILTICLYPLDGDSLSSRLGLTLLARFVCCFLSKSMQRMLVLELSSDLTGSFLSAFDVEKTRYRSRALTCTSALLLISLLPRSQGSFL